MTDFLVKRFIKNSTDVNDPAVRTAYGNLAGAVGIFCNVLLCAAKLAVGTLFGSISITADAVNNLSDASSSVITPCHRGGAAALHRREAVDGGL